MSCEIKRKLKELELSESKRTLKKKQKLLQADINSDLRVKFVVGCSQNESTVLEIIYASKLDIIIGSKFFAALLRNFDLAQNPEEPISISSPVQPKYVRMCVDFLHCFSAHRRLIQLDLVNTVGLLVAADFLLIDSLVKIMADHLVDLLKKDWSRFWETINLVVHVKQFQNSCEKLLQANTSCYLHYDSSSFLKISKSSLEYFLSMDTLNLLREKDLVDACLELVKTRQELVPICLSGLRLLTQNPVDYIGFAQYMTSEEKAYLAQRFCFDNTKDEPVPGRLCPITNSRRMLFSEDLRVIRITEELTNYLTTTLKTFDFKFHFWKETVVSGVEIVCPQNPALGNWEHFEEVPIPKEDQLIVSAVVKDQIKGKRISTAGKPTTPIPFYASTVTFKFESPLYVSGEEKVTISIKNKSGNLANASFRSACIVDGTTKKMVRKSIKSDKNPIPFYANFGDMSCIIRAIHVHNSIAHTL